MFEANYTAEKGIKMWAKVFYYVAIVLPMLAILTFFVLLCVDAEELWWIGLVAFGGSLISAVTLIFSAQMIWGYAEIIGNTRRFAIGAEFMAEDRNEELPEL